MAISVLCARLQRQPQNGSDLPRRPVYPNCPIAYGPWHSGALHTRGPRPWPLCSQTLQEEGLMLRGVSLQRTAFPDAARRSRRAMAAASSTSNQPADKSAGTATPWTSTPEPSPASLPGRPSGSTATGSAAGTGSSASTCYPPGPLRPASGQLAGFSQMETCWRLSLVKGSRVQPSHRSRSRIPASCAIRSSSAGHTYRNGIVEYSPRPSAKSA